MKQKTVREILQLSKKEEKELSEEITKKILQNPDFEAIVKNLGLTNLKSKERKLMFISLMFGRFMAGNRLKKAMKSSGMIVDRVWML